MIQTTLLSLLLLHLVDSRGLHFGYHARIGVPKAEELFRNELINDRIRIIGGSQVASASVVPYQAGIIATLTNKQQSICGGSLISTTSVLTAAHCWWDGVSRAQTFTVVLGSVVFFSGGTRLDTSNVIVHNSWNPNAAGVPNDIAVAKIRVVTLSNTIQLVPLPTTAQANTNLAGMTGTITGFGKTSDAQTGYPPTTALNRATVTIITNAACTQSLKFNILDSQVCTDGTGKKGTCDGDSGGPLTVMLNNRATLVGIVSFGPEQGCEAGLPSVYTRVTSFLTWITANSR